MDDITESGKYEFIQINGQRIFRLADGKQSKPGRDCEIFVGRLPRDVDDKEVIEILKNIGPLFEFRLMVQFTGESRGYGFAMYMTKKMADLAVQLLNNHHIRTDWPLGVCHILNNAILYITQVPLSTTKKEIFNMAFETAPSTDIDKIFLKELAYTWTVRIQYGSHRSAAIARKQLVPWVSAAWGSHARVEWGHQHVGNKDVQFQYVLKREPQPDGDEEAFVFKDLEAEEELEEETEFYKSLREAQKNRAAAHNVLSKDPDHKYRAKSLENKIDDYVTYCCAQPAGECSSARQDMSETALLLTKNIPLTQKVLELVKEAPKNMTKEEFIKNFKQKYMARPIVGRKSETVAPSGYKQKNASKDATTYMHGSNYKNGQIVNGVGYQNHFDTDFETPNLHNGFGSNHGQMYHDFSQVSGLNSGLKTQWNGSTQFNSTLNHQNLYPNAYAMGSSAPIQNGQIGNLARNTLIGNFQSNHMNMSPSFDRSNFVTPLGYNNCSNMELSYGTFNEFAPNNRSSSNFNSQIGVFSAEKRSNYPQVGSPMYYMNLSTKSDGLSLGQKMDSTYVENQNDSNNVNFNVGNEKDFDDNQQTYHYKLF